MASLVAMGSRARGLSGCDFQALELRLNSSSHGLSCSSACGMFPDHESNPYLLHWEVHSLPLSHQGSPGMESLISVFLKEINLHINFISVKGIHKEISSI